VSLPLFSVNQTQRNRVIEIPVVCSHKTLIQILQILTLKKHVHVSTGINWILSMYGANDASCTSVGTTSYPTMKFCVVPACSTSRTSSVSEDWVFPVTSSDFEVMYQQTRSYKSAPRARERFFSCCAST